MLDDVELKRAQESGKRRTILAIERTGPFSDGK
jgi:hypothetical protein